MSKYFFRFLFIAVLLMCSFSASLFMVLEAADFYRDFYPETKLDFGLWAAVLNEVFLVIMAAVWLPRIDSGKRKYFHPGNLLIKLLMLFLFVNTVGGASLNVIRTNLDKLQEEKNRIEALETLKQQAEENRETFEAFVQQKQKLNTAIAARNLSEINKELKELQLNQKSALTLWLDILLLFVLRFTIQSANITSVWLAAWLFRQPLSAPGIFHPVSVNSMKEDLKQSFALSLPDNHNNKGADTDKQASLDTPDERKKELPDTYIYADKNADSDNPSQELLSAVTGITMNPPGGTKTKVSPEKDNVQKTQSLEVNHNTRQFLTDNNSKIQTAPKPPVNTSGSTIDKRIEFSAGMGVLSKEMQELSAPITKPAPPTDNTFVSAPAESGAQMTVVKELLSPNIRPVKNETPAILQSDFQADKIQEEKDNSELMSVAESIRDMLKQSRVNITDISQELGENPKTLKQIINRNIEGISARDIHSLHQRVKDMFEREFSST